MKKVLSFVMVMALCPAGLATTWMVQPDGTEDASLWQALNQAQSGDEIVLADGLYRGQDSMSYLSNKDLTIRSLNGSQACLIDCQQSGFLYLYGSNQNQISIQGLTLMNAEGSSGAVFDLYYVDCILTDCVIRNCTSSSDGSVIYAYNGSITLDRCQFLSNSAVYDGGVIAGYYYTLNATNCVFADNEAGYSGGVLYYYEGDLTFTNCTFHNNRADEEGAILYGYYGQPTLINCIISGSSAYAFETYQSDSSEHLLLQNCLINGNSSPLYYNMRTGNTYSSASALNGLSGCSGNLSDQPGFALDTDYHITSASKAIDQGLTSVAGTWDLDGHTRVVDGDGDRDAIVDIGAYEYDPDASCLIVSQTWLEFIRDYNCPNPKDQILEISHGGGAEVAWQAQTTADWLTVDPNTGRNQTGSLTVSVATDGLERGSYFGKIQWVDPNAVNSPLTLAVVLRIRGKLLVPQTYSSIQTAVDQAMDGEIVEVQAGTYVESVSIDKALNLIGVGDPNIQGLYVNAQDCNIVGFRCEGSTSSYGLRLYGSNHTIEDVTVTGSSTGVLLSNCDNTRLTDVRISDCSTQGLSLRNCETCTLRDVAIENCTSGFSVTGSDPNDYRHDIDKSNTVDGKSIYYLTDVVDTVIAGTVADPACLYLIDCDDVVAFRLSLSGNGRAVCMVNTIHSTLRQVTVTDCESGIWLEDAPNNALIGNSVSDCVNGIVLEDSTETHMRDNACQDNQYNFTCTDSSETYTQDIDTSNTVDGKPIYYLIDESHVTLDGEDTEIGCLYAVGCHDLTVANQTLSNNSHGILLIDCSEVVLESLLIQQNTVGGLWIVDSSDIEVESSEMLYNPIGVLLEYNEGVNIERSWIAYNETGVDTYNSEYSLSSCMIHHNTEYGGVQHYSYDSDRAGTIERCTIVSNQRGTSSYEDYGGGITDSMDYLTVISSILWGNQPGQIPDASWDEYDVTYSAVQTELTGKGNISQDPGLTSDGHLTLDSPCIDTGYMTGRYRGEDIDSENRVQGERIDMGADEYLDTDLDGLPDWVELMVDPNATGVNPTDDLDEDGYNNLEEYLYYDGDILVPVATYYVDPVHGDDNLDGLTVETARQNANVVLSSMRSGERLILLPGTYNETLTLDSLAITIESQDPLDPLVVAATVLTDYLYITGGDGMVISGLSFSCQNGSYGLYCHSSSPTITHCRFTDNNGWAALYSSNGAPTLSHCIFTRNTGYVGGLYCSGSTLSMDHCLIIENQDNVYANALLLVDDCTANLANCTIAANVSDSLSPDLAAYYGMTAVPSVLMETSALTLTNTILWDGNDLITDLEDSNVWISYCDLSGVCDANWLGEGNLVVDPLFALEGTNLDSNEWIEGDYHLQSQAGRWDPVQDQWMLDEVTSPCIDAGDPNTPVGQETQSDRINMGAYGGTAEASQ